MVYGNRIKGYYEGLTSSLDIFATAIHAAGISEKTLKKPLDGVNLMPYVNGKKKGAPHSELFWRKENMAAMRMGDYKLIRVKGVGEKLYNLKDNLEETEDLQSQLPNKSREMNKAIETWEKGLVNPILWGEGVWNEVTRQIHKDLMENRKASCFSPGEWKRKHQK